MKEPQTLLHTLRAHEEEVKKGEHFDAEVNVAGKVMLSGLVKLLKVQYQNAVVSSWEEFRMISRRQEKFSKSFRSDSTSSSERVSKNLCLLYTSDAADD